MTGSTTSGKSKSAAARATAATISAEPSAPVLAAAGRDVLEHGRELFEHERRRHDFHARHAHGVLHGEQGDDGFAVDAELVKGLEVGLDAGAAAGVATGDGEGDGRHVFQNISGMRRA